MLSAATADRRPTQRRRRLRAADRRSPPTCARAACGSGSARCSAAHRALAAVDASSRAEAYFALRAALCSSPRRARRTSPPRSPRVFGEDARANPLDELGEIAKAALPRVAVPPDGDEAPARRPHARPRRLERGGAAAREGLRRLHRGRARGRPPAARPARAARPAAQSRRTLPTRRRRDEHDLRATMRASLRHGGELFERRYREPGERPRRARADLRRLGLDGAVLAHAAAVHAGLRRRPRAGRGVRVRHAADARHARAARARLRPRAGARRAPRSTTGPAARASAPRSPSSTATHGRRIGRGAMVILLSDGWDRGEPEELAGGDGAPASAPPTGSCG